MRSEILFNDGWLYAPTQLPLDAPDSDFEPITLPHTNIVLPYHNFDNAEYQFISTYRKKFLLPEDPTGRRIFLDFDGAMILSTVYLNGQQIGVNAGGFTPFSFDITDYVKPSGQNVLTVVLDSTELPEIPPYGYVVDYLTFGGIYRDVRLRMVNPAYISDVFVKPTDVLTDNVKIGFDITLTNTTDKPVTGRWSMSFATRHGKTNPHPSATGEVTIPARGKVTVQEQVEGIELPRWTLDDPKLCRFVATFNDLDTEAPEDYEHGIFGIRQAEFKDNGFYLNGQKLQLRGLNRHQTYPYIGAAAPARLQRHDAEVLKHELGLNIVRTSHYPQSPHFLSRCDEIGLLVFEEIPGWQHIGDEDWQAISLRDVQAMIVRDRNHPSIILWGVRINESQDNDALYEKTNALAHELDPTRQTGGVRNFMPSTFLEDVFTYNDFSNGVLDPMCTPHMITEFNGHMFPTKTFDGEDRKVEHARRHANIQNLAAGHPQVVGAIGWCAFDYNTHHYFGSGDYICYHGVMDIFRLPKWAAAVYASQQDPSQRVVLQAATHWTIGDRSEGGNDPLTIYSNVEEVDVWYGDKYIGRIQPDHDLYPHLPHPPFVISLGREHITWGKAFQNLRIVGYINGKQVAEQNIDSNGKPACLELAAIFPEIKADGADITPIVVRITDQFGNALPYAIQPVTLTVEGNAELIGENPIVPPGGQGALYLKAGHNPGEVTITATTNRLESATVTVTLR